MIIIIIVTQLVHKDQINCPQVFLEPKGLEIIDDT